MNDTLPEKYESFGTHSRFFETDKMPRLEAFLNLYCGLVASERGYDDYEATGEIIPQDGIEYMYGWRDRMIINVNRKTLDVEMRWDADIKCKVMRPSNNDYAEWKFKMPASIRIA